MNREQWVVEKALAMRKALEMTGLTADETICDVIAGLDEVVAEFQRQPA